MILILLQLILSPIYTKQSFLSTQRAYMIVSHPFERLSTPYLIFSPTILTRLTFIIHKTIAGSDLLPYICIVNEKQEVLMRVLTERKVLEEYRVYKLH